MKIYLDTSVYNRPFDDQTQPRIWLETLALAVILELVETDEAIACQRTDESIRKRAAELEKKDLSAIDALHVACAEFAGADYFLTCDNRLLKKAKLFKVKSMNPLDFVQKEIGEQP